MKVRIYKGSNNKGMFKSSLPKAEEGTAVDMENDIDQKLMDGYDPEVIIMEMIDTYGKSRAEVKDLVYNKFFNNDFSDEDEEEEEVIAPYDNSTDNEVIEDVNAIEPEPNNAEQYGYFTSSGQGRDLVNEDADEEEDEYTARYGGQYADGGQFAPGSIIPQPKKPYYIGMDGEPYDNAYAFGGNTYGFGGPGDGDKRRSFYDTAVTDYKQWLTNPAAWQEDPEMLAPDGKTLNLCLDCMDMDWNNEQDIRDAHRLIEEGYSTGTHRNQELFDAGLKKYGLQTPVWSSKKQISENKFGGLTKNQYVNKRIKELRKAALGDEVKNNETNISPRGTIDNPSGFTSPEKNIASIIKQTGNEAKLKETAENEYQQYQESTMGDNFNGKFLFGGRNRKIKRANKALFGTPIAIPGVDVNYEFGPLGGLRKATANWDLDAIGGLAKFLPGMAGMMPGMGGNYKATSYPAQVRKKTVSTINNAALDDVAKQNPNSDAAQNNRSDKKNEISCPPGSVYDPSLGHCVDQEGNMVRSIVDLPDPEELLGNPFENPNARMLSGKKTMKATGPSSSASSTAASQSTQVPAAGGAPLQSQQGIDYEAWKYAGAQNPFSTRAGNEYWNAIDNGEYVKKSGAKDNPNTFSNENQVWSSPVDQNKYNELWHLYNTIGPEALTPEQLNLIQQGSYITTDDQGNEYSSNAAYFRPNPDVSAMKEDYKRMSEVYGERDSDYVRKNEKLFQKEHGGFVDAANMDPNALAKFIYGGDEYAYGGDVLPQAYDGFAGNFQKQMLATKNRINQMGSKNPADYNPFKGNAFGKATTGVQPSGTVGNRFQPTNQPNTSTTTQPGGAGTNQPGGGSGIMSQQRSEELAKMTPEQRAAEGKKYEAMFQQMMQGQQGNPFMGNAFGNQQFWTGRPQRLGFGLTRDFNYGSSYSPVNWKVPEGTKHLRQETYKDRGKWYNPFDTKRITDYYADPNDEGASGDLINKQGSGKNIKTGTSFNPSESETAKERLQNKRYDKFMAEGWKMGDDETQDPPTSMKTLSTAPNLPDQLESGAPGRMQPLPASQIPLQGTQNTELDLPENQGETELQNNPFQGNAFEGNQFGTAAGVSPSENMRFTQGPNNFSPSAENTNPFTGNAFGTSSTGVTGNANMSRPAAPSPTYPQPGVENPMADPKFVPTPQDYNPESNPASTGTIPSQQGDSGYMGENDPLNQMPMAYGGYMAQGGYVPEYMAYGGYMPHAKSGITVENPEFNDPNFIGREIENSAYTFNGDQAVNTGVGIGKVAANFGNAWDQAKQSGDMAARYRTFDGAKANTGQPGSGGSAEVTGTDSESGQMGSKGHYDQYGVNVGSIGFNGNNVITKKGGSINSQYSKGKVYSLTIEQIKAIEAAGGKVEYIK